MGRDPVPLPARKNGSGTELPGSEQDQGPAEKRVQPLLYQVGVTSYWYWGQTACPQSSSCGNMFILFLQPPHWHLHWDARSYNYRLIYLVYRKSFPKCREYSLGTIGTGRNMSELCNLRNPSERMACESATCYSVANLAKSCLLAPGRPRHFPTAVQCWCVLMLQRMCQGLNWRSGHLQNLEWNREKKGFNHNSNRV